MRTSILAAVAAAALSISTWAAAPGPSSPSSPPPLARAAAIEPAGPALLARDAETVVDPASTFELELSARLADARLVLLDSAEAHVAGRSTREVGASTRLTLAPASPLVPGSRYVLRVEGAATREVRDGERAWAPLSFPILAAGTPPPPEPKRKPKKRKRT